MRRPERKGNHLLTYTYVSFKSPAYCTPPRIKPTCRACGVRLRKHDYHYAGTGFCIKHGRQYYATGAYWR